MSSCDLSDPSTLPNMLEPSAAAVLILLMACSLLLALLAHWSSPEFRLHRHLPRRYQQEQLLQEQEEEQEEQEEQWDPRLAV